MENWEFTNVLRTNFWDVKKKSTISTSFAYPVMTVKFGAKVAHLRIHFLRLKKRIIYFVYSLCFEHIESIFQRNQNGQTRINM